MNTGTHKKNHENFNVQKMSGPYCNIVWEFVVGLFSSSAATSSWSVRNLGAQTLLFFVCKTKVCVLAVLDSANVGIVWVALCFTPFNFIITALKIRQLEQSMVLYMWSHQTFYAVEE